MERNSPNSELSESFLTPPKPHILISRDFYVPEMQSNQKGKLIFPQAHPLDITYGPTSVNPLINSSQSQIYEKVI